MIFNRCRLVRATAPLLAAVLSFGIVSLLALPAGAQIIDWNNAGGGNYTKSRNWNPANVPNTAGETARFNLGAAMVIGFPAASSTTINDLLVLQGDVTFRNAGSFNDAALTMSGDFDMTGGALTLARVGSTADVNLNITDRLRVIGTAEFNIREGAQVDANRLSLGTSGGDGTLVVENAGSSLDFLGFVTSPIGEAGSTGHLMVQDSAGATFNGRLNIAVANAMGSSGTVDVLTGGDITANGAIFVGIGSATGQSAIINVDGLGSTFTQNNATRITVGSSLVGNVAEINVLGSGEFSTGTSTTTINPNGAITIGTGGTFDANGPVMVNGGTITRNSTGNFNLASGMTLTATNFAQITFNGSYEIDQGTTFDFHNGADLRTTGSPGLGIGNGSDGTLVIDGSGSNLTIAGGTWGTGGGTADVTIRNSVVGTLQSIDLAGDNAAGTTGIFNVESGSVVSISNLDVASSGGATTVGTVTVDGAGTLAAINTLTLGHASTGTATIDITNGGTFTTAPGTKTINATGTLNVGVVGGGTFNANGDVVVDGGTINRGPTGAFSLAFGRTLTASNNAQINITGAYDILGATFDIQSGSDFSTTSSLDVSLGTLLVDGAGSSVTTGASTAQWGEFAARADVTFRNNATGSLGDIHMASFTIGSATAILNVESGATVTTGFLVLAEDPGFFSAGTITIDGVGSSLTQNGTAFLTLGQAVDSTATINVENSGAFTTGTGLTTINATGTLNVNTAGTFDALGNIELAGTINLAGGTIVAPDIIFTGSTVNFTSGTLELNSNQTLDATRLADLDVATLTGGKTFRVNGSTTLLAPMTLTGGTFSTQSLANPAVLDFRTGTFELTGDDLVVGPAGLFGAPLAVASGQTIRVTNMATVAAGETLLIESGGSFDAGTLANNGSVVLTGAAAVLRGTTINNVGSIRGDGTISAAVNNNADGEIRGETGKTLLLTGVPGVNAGQINLQGGTLEFDQALTNGPGGDILGRGTLVVGGTGLTNTGDVALSNGQTDVFGDVDNQGTGRFIVSGNADVTFWDDVTHSGVLFNVSDGASATFFGEAGFSVSGGGDVFFEADVTPGSSPGLVTFGGNVHFGALANLEIELAGTVPGSEHDQLDIAGIVSLEGTLTLEGLDSISSMGDATLTILNALTVSGTFADVPDLNDGFGAGHLGMGIFFEGIDYNPSSVTIDVLQAAAGDVNGDRVVNADDIQLILGANAFNNPAGGPYTWLQGDNNGDGLVDAIDIQNILATNLFGKPAYAALPGGATAVPEPSTLVLAMLALAALFVPRLRRRSTIAGALR